MKNKDPLANLDTKVRKILPLDILLATKISPSNASKIIVSKSNSYQTDMYELEQFYKYIRMYEDI